MLLNILVETVTVLGFFDMNNTWWKGYLFLQFIEKFYMIHRMVLNDLFH